jgi:hypothetical protein
VDSVEEEGWGERKTQRAGGSGREPEGGEPARLKEGGSEGPGGRLEKSCEYLSTLDAQICHMIENVQYHKSSSSFTFSQCMLMTRDPDAPNMRGTEI